MKALKQFIANENRIAAMFGNAHQQINFPLTQGMANDIARSLDCHLSPENLHCDGEISPAEADRKYRFYESVYRDLEKYCLTNWLNTPVIYEL